MSPETGPVAYIMKRYPRLTETFILNEIRAMERLGVKLEIFSLLPPEPPPHHPMVAEVTAPVRHLPAAWRPKLAALARAHAATAAAAPLRYAGAFGRALLWSVVSRRPASVWKQFIRGGYVATACRRAGIGRMHAHFANAPAAVTQFASLMSGIPFSFTTHAKDLYLTPRRVMLSRVRAASFVTTCTGYNADFLRGFLPESEHHKVHLVYHGIDLSLFAFRETPDPAGASGPPPLILSVGRLVPKKGLDDLIAACAMLREAGNDFRCTIVGEGPLRGDLEADIRRRGLDGIVALEGAMTHARLIDLYRTADLFALPPRIAADGDRDGIPNVIAEAMAIGVPVVSTEVSGIPELVKHQVTGLLVPPSNPKRLAEAMQHVLDAPRDALRMARAARAELERNFDCWETTRRLRSLITEDACCATPHARFPLYAQRGGASRAASPIAAKTRWIAE